MEKRTGEILIGAGVLIGLGYFAMQHSKQSFAKDTANLRLRIAGVAVNEGDITISIKVQNPNSTSMEIRSLVGDMFANAKKIAEIKMFGDYVAQGNSEISFPVVARPVLTNFFKTVQDIFKHGKAVVDFAGTINVNGHTLPLKLTYSK